jgi:hypothetical protein
VSDALQHDSVEAWFHSLIRRHFKGNLKVGHQQHVQHVWNHHAGRLLCWCLLCAWLQGNCWVAIVTPSLPCCPQTTSNHHATTS